MVKTKGMIHICLIEDEEKVASFIKKGLEEQGFKVDVGKDPFMGRELLSKKQYDLLLLDVMLPGMNGNTFCKEVRAANPSIPILMLTALGTTDDKVLGLKSGADDYLVKPFHFDELIARIEALIRRANTAKEQKQVLAYADLELDTWSKTAQRAGKTIPLTAKEYALLELFLENPNKLLSRKFIAEKVWQIDFDTGTNMVDVYINYLRNKIERGFDNKLIHTIIGMGYILRQEA